MWTSGADRGHLVLQCITIFGSLRLLRRATPWWRIMAFAVLQSFLCNPHCPHMVPSWSCSFSVVHHPHPLFHVGL